MLVIEGSDLMTIRGGVNSNTSVSLASVVLFLSHSIGEYFLMHRDLYKRQQS